MERTESFGATLSTNTHKSETIKLGEAIGIGNFVSTGEI